MAQVTVTIDGKAYRMACEEGQEAHLADLAHRFDQYIGHLKSQFGEIGDLRISVMAGIMIIDELAEARGRAELLQAELDTLKAGGASDATARHARETALATSIGDCAARLETMAAKLSGRQGPALN